MAVKIRNVTKKDNVINKIIEREWEMFVNVNNIGGGKASCQNDKDTFYIMRYSQHNNFGEEMLNSYMNDLCEAKVQKRNLLAEKYAFMMEYTDKNYFDTHLKNQLPEMTVDKLDLVAKIAKEMIDFRKAIENKYPNFEKRGRTIEESNGGNTSSFLYLIGETKTYSLETLRLMHKDINIAKSQNVNLVLEIYKTTVSFYGNKTLEEVEATLK